MFANLRYVCLIIFALLVFLTLLAGNYFKSAFIDSIVKSATEQQSNIILDNYSKIVWNRYYPVINYLHTQPSVEWDVYPQYQDFKSESQAFFKTESLLKAVIYDSNNYVILDTSSNAEIADKGDFLDSLTKGDKHALNLIEAKNGKTVYNIIPNYRINGQTKTIFNIFLPLQIINDEGNVDDSKNNGIIEFNFDISDTYSKIERTQLTLVVLMILGLVIFTGAVLIASKKAENVIEKQQEASLEMSSAKMLAESESKAKSQFLANVSHELRTPLNAIIGFSEIINSESMGPIGNDQYKEFIKDINTSGVHLLSLINDILDFSKAEENKLEVDLEQTDLTKIVKVCMRMVLTRAENAKVKLNEEIPNEHVIVMADQKRMKQALLNLLSNAIKFTPEGGEVTLKAWRDIDSHTMIIEVKDTGVGMAAQDLARALSPFGQVDNKLSRRYEGTGLGLPLTKKLVELMKGHFEIKSEPNLGTTVTLTFPLPNEEVELTSNLTATKPENL